MDWDKITKDALSQMRTSRLRKDIRADGAAVSGLSLEDYIQTAVEEYLANGGEDLHVNPGETTHDALVRHICEITYRKADNDRRNRARRHQILHDSIDELDPKTASQFVDPLLPIRLLDCVQDDDEATLIMICVLDGMSEFDDTQYLSELTELPIAKIENAKRRIRRKLRHQFGGIRALYYGEAS